MLSKDVAMWATPDVARRGTEHPDKLAKRKKGKGGCRKLQTEAEYLPLVQAITTDGVEFSLTRRTSRPRLNPAFACWLMGWPWWWTHPDPINFGAEEMESYRYKLRLLLSGLLEGF